MLTFPPPQGLPPLLEDTLAPGKGPCARAGWPVGFRVTLALDSGLVESPWACDFNPFGACFLIGKPGLVFPVEFPVATVK